MLSPLAPTLSFPPLVLWGCVALYGCLLFFPGLGDRDLTSSHEARAAQNAQTILDEGHWLVPRLFDRHLELQKPPLYYWLVALIGWLQGGAVDAWAVRLPSACSALGCMLVLCYLGQRSHRPMAGILAALILASCLHFTWLARVGRIDMPMTFTITLALGAFHVGNLDGAARFRWHALGYASLAAGVMLKGPIALVLPALVSAGVWVHHGRLNWTCHWQQIRATTLWWGVPWLFALAAPWFVWANYRTENQLWEVFVWYHNVERGLGGSETLASHPWWFYLPRAFVDLLPWSLAIPVAAVWLYRNKIARQDDAAWMGLLWFGAIALILSCMRFKRADYLLPAYPGVAIFLGACAEQFLPSPSRRGTGGAGGFLPSPHRGRGAGGAGAFLPSPHRGRGAGGEGAAPSLAQRSLRGLFVALLVVYALSWVTHQYLADDAEQPYRAIAQEIRSKTNRPVIFFRAEAHVLAFHVGRPLDTILEWENLAIWADRPYPVYVVMPEECAREWRDHLPADALEEVLRTSDYEAANHERPLVVLRSRGKAVAKQ